MAMAPGSIAKPSPVIEYGDEQPHIDTDGPIRHQCQVQLDESKIHGSATLADIDDDNNLEAIVASFDGVVSAVDISESECSVKWQYEVQAGKISGQMLVVDHDHDGEKTIIFGDSSGGDGVTLTALNESGEVLATTNLGWVGTGGAAASDIDEDSDLEIIIGGGRHHLFFFELTEDGWQKEYVEGKATDPNFANADLVPSIADYDRDGNKEVVWHTSSAHEHTGWIHITDTKNREFDLHYNTTNIVRPSPTFVNADTDPELEIFALSNNQIDGGEAAGIMHLLDDDGSVIYEKPILPNGGDYDAPWPNPVFGDVDQDGDTEVIITSHDDRIRRVDLATGRVERMYDLSPNANNPHLNHLNFESQPSITDFDGDGEWEIIVGTNDNRTIVFSANLGVEANYIVETQALTRESGDPDFEASPAIADVDGDGHQEVVIGNFDGLLYVFESTEVGGGPEWHHGMGRSVVGTNMTRWVVGTPVGS